MLVGSSPPTVVQGPRLPPSCGSASVGTCPLRSRQRAGARWVAEGGLHGSGLEMAVIAFAHIPLAETRSCGCS